MKRIPPSIMTAVTAMLAPYGGIAALTSVKEVPTAGPRWMNQKLASKEFGVCYQTMRVMVARGEVRARKINRMVLVDVNSLATQQAKEQ